MLNNKKVGNNKDKAHPLLSFLKSGHLFFFSWRYCLHYTLKCYSDHGVARIHYTLFWFCILPAKVLSFINSSFSLSRDFMASLMGMCVIYKVKYNTKLIIKSFIAQQGHNTWDIWRAVINIESYKSISMLCLNVYFALIPSVCMDCMSQSQNLPSI